MADVFLPVFVSSFFVVQWYGGAIILVLIGVIIASRQGYLPLFPFALFCGYILLYAFHIRTYYEMQSGTTGARAALRFSMSLMSMWSILAGLGTAYVVRWLQHTRVWTNYRSAANWVAGCTLAAIVGASFFATDYFREDIVRDESRIRFEPSLTAVRLASKDTKEKAYILTLEPLILQMYADPNVNVISLRSLNGAVMKDIGFVRGQADVFYLDEQIHRGVADGMRYESQLTYLNQFRRNQIAKAPVFSVVEIGNYSPADYGTSEVKSLSLSKEQRVPPPSRN